MSCSGCALRPDAQAFDEVRIVTIPRFKESGLSGDEWRIHAEAQFYRKGQLIFSVCSGCALRPDAQAFDEVRIVTIPRFKESGLSGDEWRIHAEAQFYRKGQLIFSEGCRDVKTACGLAFGWYVRACDDGKGYFAGDGLTCDQEGCHEPAVIRYVRKFDYCRDGHKRAAPDTSKYRHFCEKHKARGDAAFDDSDDNYDEVPMEAEGE